MIKKLNIHNNIESIDKLFNLTRSKKELFFYSKLAILELCGWIEITMDDIILTYSKKKLTVPHNRVQIENSVKRLYSFEYEKFRDLTTDLIGLVKIEKLENKLDLTGSLQILRTTLGNLKTKRNSLAHTHSQKIQMTLIYAPSDIKNDFAKIYVCLQEYQKELTKL